MACKSQPPEVDPYPDETGEKVFGSFKISQEMYDSTLAEVKLFVDGLNSLIMSKNYEGWKAALSNEFFARVSSPEFLAGASESAALKSQKIVLKTPNDYFTHVVVPSRNNSKVDEIEFTAADRVKVYYREERARKNENTSTTEARRLRLYELVKADDTWKIID
jgi:hypothetical protein